MLSDPSDERVILVTGSNKGIGYEAVKLLSPTLPKATILLASRSTDNGLAAIKKMQEATPGHSFSNVKVVELDVTDKSSTELAVKQVQSDYGRLDVLINNSGISNVNGNMKAKAIFDVNVQGACDCVEAFLPIIPSGGTIVMVSSGVGAMAMNSFTPSLRERLDDPTKVTRQQVDHLSADWLKSAHQQSSDEDWAQCPIAYTVSKALISAWCRAFALQHPEVKMAVVCPGYCATDLNHHKGTRPAVEGGESIVWPLFHAFETGHFYRDGKEVPFIAENGAQPPPPPIEQKD